VIIPLSLQQSVQYLKGVGPKRAALLHKLEIRTLWDILCHYPREHEDRTKVTPVIKAHPGSTVTLKGLSEGFEIIPVGRNLAIGKVLLKDETGFIWAVWYRRTTPRYDVFANWDKKFAKGSSLWIHGPVERYHHETHVRVDEFELATEKSAIPIHMDRLVPLYPLTEGVDAKGFRELVWQTLQTYTKDIREYLPEPFLEKHRLQHLPEAIRQIHFPDTLAQRDQARRRFAFEEFFFLEMAMAQVRRTRHQNHSALACTPRRTYLTPFRKTLGFEMTNDQKKAVNDIFSDMAQTTPMNRLLQGDVGSGKTVVALSAMLLAVENGQQAVLMAPTEILAEQHFLTLKKFLEGLPLQWALFSRHLTAAQRRRQIQDLEEGRISLAIGTHALLEEDIRFKKLGLVIVDEQHRFGVRQRAILQRKAPNPHVLIMTATPIPRTLALTLYGDLSVSTIRELPPGRPVLTTHWTLEENAFAAVRREVEAGRQAFIVSPLVEESEKMDLNAAVAEWERLRTTVFSQHEVGLIHGRMKPGEKERIMTLFTDNKINILAATPVVEVGIDIPNATIMVILNAERYGLAQLHQLRGRVGRGRFASSCYLVADPKSNDAVRRLKILCETTDGFRIAEEDLQLRGPGEFLGEAQHGLPPFKVGNLVKDIDLIQEARQAAFSLYESDPECRTTEHLFFQKETARRFSGKLGLGQVS